MFSKSRCAPYDWVILPNFNDPTLLLGFGSCCWSCGSITGFYRLNELLGGSRLRHFEYFDLGRRQRRREGLEELLQAEQLNVPVDQNGKVLAGFGGAVRRCGPRGPAVLAQMIPFEFGRLFLVSS